MRRKRRPQKRQRVRRNTLLRLGTASVLMAAIAILAVFLLSSGDAFSRASKHEGRREEYIASVVKRFPPPENVAKVEYATLQEVQEQDASPLSRISEESGMATTYLKTKVGTERPLAVFILPSAFSGERIQKEEDFLGALLHEYDHARVHRDSGFAARTRTFFALSEFEGTNLFIPVVELQALKNELQRVVPENSQAYQETIQQRYLAYYVEFWRKADALDHALLSDLKVEFFPVFMLQNRNDLFTNPALGVDSDKRERFLLSPQEVEKVRALY